MRRTLVLLLVLLPTVAAQPLLVAVVPDLSTPGPGDEGFAVGNGGSSMVWLAGYQVTDGEGTWALPDQELAPGDTAWFTGNQSAWSARDGPPAAVWDAEDLVLANHGDTLELLRDGVIVDGFAWGDKQTSAMIGAITTRSPDLVYRRATAPDSWQDTDHADDWRTPRMHRVGESDLDRPTFANVTVRPYASPDDGFQVLADLVGTAQERLWLHVYQLRSQALVDRLVAAVEERPRLDLRVLVDGSPVGMTADHRQEVAHGLQRIQDAGGQVWSTGPQRYDHHHLKVLLVDDAVAVQSENWVPAGVPEDPSWGNRGWGVVVHGAAVADWFASWLQADQQAWDTNPFQLSSFALHYEEPPRFHPPRGDHDPAPSAEPARATVTPIVAPDHSADGAYLEVIDRASTRVWVQQLSLRTDSHNALGWSQEDVLLAALVAAAERGVDVRVMVARPFSADDDRNRPAVDALLAAGAQVAHLDRPGIATLHNKGIVADDRVVVGSINGNHHSRAENREVVLLVDSAAVADHFAGLFSSDWSYREPLGDTALPEPRSVPATSPTLFVLLAVVALLRRV